MDTNQLQTFDQIVRLGSFSKAARVLDIAQPTISARLRQLEQEVGGALLLRGGSRLELTELGRSFLPYARQALAVLSKGVETARLAEQGKRGQVVIATLPTLAAGFFASALARVREENPQLGIAVHTGHNREVVEMLYDGFIKIGFLIWPYLNADLTTRLTVEEPLLVAVPAGHPLALRGKVTLEELKEEANPFWQIDWGHEVKGWQALLICEPGTEIEVPPQTALDLLLRGQGAALLTRAMAGRALERGELVELQVEGMPQLSRKSVLVQLGHDPLPPAVEEFIRLFREEAKLGYNS
ncbi:LysR family transcriptional regulator [Tumebacillus sp. BK434]|uniref:LysR family transcriptional regulator n=1 Tax=Tumebacillus sp. BK434 TaxID=2512169 RepID=UPI001052BF67|nr:LysR family transcriptional regulator [Tumebacillus sp. BK434]TCP53343.1 LysR family transcriptional regulator [Tumebacillus sp. BK434]